MASATFNTISVEEVIWRAKIQLRVQNTTEHDDYLEIMAVEALNSLNALSQLVKSNCCLNITGHSAELPKNFVRYLALKINIESDTTNDPIQNQLFSGCQMALYADTKFLSSCGCDSSGALDWSQGGFQINKGFIHFNSDVTITEATLAYLGLNVDKDEKMVIFERYERAVASYICWKFSMAFFDKYHQYIIESYRAEWAAQRSLMIGRDNAQSFQSEKREIQALMGAFLTSPILNYNI